MIQRMFAYVIFKLKQSLDWIPHMIVRNKVEFYLKITSTAVCFLDALL